MSLTKWFVISVLNKNNDISQMYVYMPIECTHLKGKHVWTGHIRHEQKTIM